ncbi:DUF7639 domain-containing protein [Streptomyces sp. R-07]|uniref:DUF7639 domain-containing protein n=1 Tax=Streptomyces sp. R-07 TaxID=3404052 RepID=UPI003CE6A64E
MHGLVRWKFSEVRSQLTAHQLIAEVRDTIDQAAPRAAFLATPALQAPYSLVDMDSKDWPLRVLVAPGGRTYLPSDPCLSTRTRGRCTSPRRLGSRTHRRHDQPAARQVPPVACCRARPHGVDDPSGLEPSMLLRLRRTRRRLRVGHEPWFRGGGSPSWRARRAANLQIRASA